MGISNLKWREAMAEVKAINEANTFFSRDECLAGWPETLKPDQLAVLQRPYSKSDTLQAGKTAAFREWIESACLAGLLLHIEGKEIKHRERKIPTGTHLHEAARLLTEDTSYEVDICHIKASDFAVLLASEGEEPSVHLAGWIKATTSEPPALPTEAAGASGSVESDKAGPVTLKSETLPHRNAPPVVVASTSGGVETDKAEPVMKPWLVKDPKDPEALQLWYTPARYFARQLVIADSTLLTKRLVLADKVSKSLTNANFLKRGNKKSLSPETVKKAFVNVRLD